jgi:hypothetical protein
MADVCLLNAHADSAGHACDDAASTSYGQTHPAQKYSASTFHKFPAAAAAQSFFADRPG